MRPNILYLHSHDTGRYVQPYGYAIPTPRIQRLAEEGVLFRQAYCAAPTCSPSRAALLTGQAAHSSGMIGLAHRGFRLADYSQHLVRTLQAAGYHCALAGIQHEAPDVALIGYDRVLPALSNHAADVARAAAQFLRQAQRQPFFLSVGSFETHRVFPSPGPTDDPRYVQPPRPLPDTPEIRRDMAAFHTSARALDEGISVVLEALEEQGLAGNTLVICTTDHGIAFPGMKCNLTDHGTGVMLIMRGPGGFTGGRVVDGMISQVDVFPTLCDLIGVERPAWLQGVSLLPLVTGEATQVRDELFAEVSYHAAYEPQRAVRTQRWKYIRRFEARACPVLPNCDDSPSKDVWLSQGWGQQPLAGEQLFDLVFDPNEAQNLALDPAHAGVLDDMRTRLMQWMAATADPLLDGPVAAPAGARINDPDGLSPQETPKPVA